MTDRPSRKGRWITNGTRLAVRNLFRELKANLRHWALRHRCKRASLAGHRLNIGCGKYPLAGWVNADLFSPADLAFDIREPWPIPDDQVQLVRLEHVLEHVGYPDSAAHVLSECFRVLRPNGVVRVGVPDTASVLKAYCEGSDSEYFRIARERWHPSHVRLPIEHVNFHFRDRYGEHLFAYDRTALTAALESAGFQDITLGPFDPEIDREDREAGTLRLCGRKPQVMEASS